MMMALPSCIRAILVGLSLGVLAGQAPAAESRGCDQQAAAGRAPLSDHARMLLDALSGDDARESPRLDPLHAAVTDPPEPLSPAEYWLTQRATLVIAGEYLRAGEFRAARSLLRDIPVESPAAVDAGLLLAESFRLDNARQQAQQWYLRVGERFPHSRDALRGVLAAARAMSSTNPAGARALYKQVDDHASTAAARLEALGSRVHKTGLSILLAPEVAAAHRLRPQLLQRMAQTGERNALALQRSKLRNTGRLGCILESSRPLYQARAGLRRKLDHLNERIPRLEEQLRSGQRRLKRTRADIRPGRLDEEQRRIRKSVTTLRNSIRRKQARLRFLRETRQKVPGMVQRLEDRLLRLYGHYQGRKQKAHERLDTLLANSIEGLRNDFLDLAGQARHRHAALLEAAARPDASGAE